MKKKNQIFNPAILKGAIKNVVFFYYNFVPMVGFGYCVDYFRPDKCSPQQKTIHVYFPFIILSWWITDIPNGVKEDKDFKTKDQLLNSL